VKVVSEQTALFVVQTKVLNFVVRKSELGQASVRAAIGL